MDAQNHQEFIDAYGQEIFDSIAEAVESKNLPRVAASLIYLIEMCEEVVFHNAKFDLIGTRLYGFRHNREQNALEMNYLLSHEVAGQLDYREMVQAVSRFIGHDFHSNTFRDPHIRPLQSIIPPLFNVFFDQVRSVNTETTDYPLTEEEEFELLDQHNQMVQAHLTYRENHPDIPVTSYTSMEDALESKRMLTYQNLPDDAQAVYAAFVYLNAQGDRYSHGDIERLTGLNRSQVRGTTALLMQRRFIVRNKNQKFHTTDITFDYLTESEAANILNTYLYRNGDIANLSWMEAALLTTLIEEGSLASPIQMNLSDLTVQATNGAWTQSNGDVSAAISSLVMRGVLDKDTSTRPYSYTVLFDITPRQVLENVRLEDREELESLGYTLPDVTGQETSVEEPETVYAGKASLKPVGKVASFEEDGEKGVTLIMALRNTIQALLTGQRSITIPECTMTIDEEEGFTIRFSKSDDS